jgi:hypothetical protein
VLVLLLELACFYLIPAALTAVSGWNLREFYDSLIDPEYATSVSILGVVLVCIQTAFLLPLRPPPKKDDPSPGALRLAAIALSIGVIAGALAVYLTLGVNELGASLDLNEVCLTEMWLVPAIVSPLAFLWLFRRYRRAMPIIVSVIAAALLAGCLLAALFLSVIGLIQLFADFDLNAPLEYFVLSAPLVGWAVFTPIIIAFVRRADPHSQLARLSSILLIGTAVETVVTIPIDVMARRKTNCYCDTGSFWSLALTLSIGAVVLGPAIYLAPVRRARLRQVQGRCRACGYDMSATPKADRCPECGAGWTSESETARERE